MNSVSPLSMITPDLSIEQLNENFALFDDWEDRYRYLIDLGRKLPPLPDELKTEVQKVRGCMSQVWMVPGHPVGAAGQPDLGKFAFAADSDAHIVKGLIAVLGVLFSGKTPAEIAAIDTDAAFRTLGLDQHISPSRRNGLVSMVEKIKGYAKAG
jgi:cysteine desulfuration protein SufE